VISSDSNVIDELGIKHENEWIIKKLYQIWSSYRSTKQAWDQLKKELCEENWMS
ncbi:6125_t:CDS:2, partial [Racocetra persica]